MWTTIHETLFTEDCLRDLSNFKSGPHNFRIALWDPDSRGLLYLKTLLNQLCASLSATNWLALDNIQNRAFGNPIAVKHQGREICMDYAQAVLEMVFMERHIELDGEDILEIGAGYGRTCHAILSNIPVRSYTIVDLDQCLNLTRSYLGRVLDEASFAKIRFVHASEFDQLNSTQFKLCLNIDSFAEMDAPVVRYYLRYIERQCQYLYVKNPVGKYLSGTDIDSQTSTVAVEMALKTGLLRDIIDRFDSQAVADQSVKFLDVYRPGAGWQCIDSSLAPPWSWYWQALFSASAVLR